MANERWTRMLDSLIPSGWSTPNEALYPQLLTLQDLGDVVALIHFGHEFLELRAERVVRRDHTYWPPLFDYRDIAKPALVHHVQRVAERFVGADGARICRHHLGQQGRFRIAPLGRHAEEGVALGEYADKALLVTYHESAGFMGSHQARSVADRRCACGSQDRLVLDNRSDRPVCHSSSPSQTDQQILAK